MKKIILFLTMLFSIGASMAQTIVFSDNFESGTSNWTLTNNWGLSTAHSHSTSHALTESPIGNYSNNETSYATMTTGVNLSSALSATLSFWAIYNIEGGFDYMYLQVSANNGTTWNTIDSYDDTSTVWTQYTYSLGGYCGNSAVKVRFKFVSDGSVNYDGMYIDDFQISSSNTDNSPPLVLHSPRPFYEGMLGADTLQADIIDISGVALAQVIYSVDGGANDTINATNISGNTYTFLVPQQEPGAMVSYHFYAEDSTTSGNPYTGSTYQYIAGEHVYFDNGIVDFVDSVSGSSGAAKRITLNGPTRIAAVLIRNYTDPNRPNDSIQVHVWSSQLGVPGSDLITPVTVKPAATLQNTSPMTVVDLRADSAALSNLSGDVFIGYTVPSGSCWLTLTQPSTVNRSYKLGTGGWALASGSSGGSDYHFRAITSGLSQPPVASFTYDASTDPLVSFTNTSSNATAYSWDFGDGSTASTATNPTHTFPHNGTFSVCLTATGTAGSDSACAQISISSYTAPVSNFGFDISNDPTVVFSDSSSNNPTAWYWDFDDNGASSTQQNPTHTYPAIGGTFHVCLTASNVNGNGNIACKDVVLSVGAGMDDEGHTKDIKIYPNPLKNNAFIEILNQNSGEVSLQVYDMTGRLVPVNYSVNKQGIVMKRGHLQAGTYIFRVRKGKDEIYTGTLIVR